MHIKPTYEECEFCSDPRFPLLTTCYNHAEKETIEILWQIVKYPKRPQNISGY